MLPELWLILIPVVLLVIGVQYFISGRWDLANRARLFLGLLVVLVLIGGISAGSYRLSEFLFPILSNPDSPLCHSLGKSCETIRSILSGFTMISSILYLLQVAVAVGLIMFWPGRRGWSPARVVLAIGLAGLALLLGGFASGSFLFFVFFVILVGGLAFLVWRAWIWGGRLRYLAWAVLAIFLGLVLFYELAPSSVWAGQTNGIFHLPFFMYSIWPAFATSLAARLWFSGILSPGKSTMQPEGGTGSGSGEWDGQVSDEEGVSLFQGKQSRWHLSWSNGIRRLVMLGMMALLLWQLNNLLVREGVWDQTTDGLTSVFIQHIVISVGLAGAVLMAWTTSGWRKLGALAFVVLVLLDMNWAMQRSWELNPNEVTEVRAKQIGAAIERYYDGNSRYPPELSSLVPFYLLHIPEPVMERGEGWCYQAGPDYYRLGYVWKPGFTPEWEKIKIRIASSAGQPPVGAWECDQELERIRQHWKDYWKDAKIFSGE